MSAVPNALDALLAAIAAVLPDTQLSDGPPVVELAKDTIVVGWSQDGAGADITTSPGGFVSTDQEDIDIACLISCLTGDTAIRPLREAAFGYYDTIAAKIRLDKTLAGAVASARMAVTGYRPAQTPNGATVDLTFTVTCIAFV